MPQVSTCKTIVFFLFFYIRHTPQESTKLLNGVSLSFDHPAIGTPGVVGVCRSAAHGPSVDLALQPAV